jgi:hypothetical protein
VWSDEDAFLKQTQFSNFTNMLETQPHNTGHVLTGFPASGKPGHIGDGLSPLDPIFWMHHTMVNFMWARGQKAGNVTQDDNQITRHAEVTERNLVEQTRYAEQLGQARQEAAELRLRLIESTTATSPGAPNVIIKKQSGKAFSTRKSPVESRGE